MKRVLTLFPMMFFLVAICVRPAYAEVVDSSSTSYISAESTPLLGNSHSYSVTAKASGILVVNARIVITNNTTEPKTDFVFSGLGATRGKFTGYQQIKGRSCTRPDYENKKCLEYGDPDYSQYSSIYYYGYDESTTYQPLEITNKDGVISGKLPVAIESYKSSALAISYYLSNQTKSGLFGQKRFEFTSLQDENLIKDVNVSVDTDADLYVRGGRSNVTKYSDGLNSSSITSLSASISSKSLDSAVSSIGSYGSWMNKSGTDIVPGETFSVSGAYSTTWLGMYWEILLVILLVIALIIMAIWWLARKRPGQKTPNDNIGIELQNSSPEILTSLSFREAATIRNFLSSFIFGICIILFFVGIITLMEKSFSYRFASLLTFVGLAFCLILAGIAIGYPIYLGVKRGINAAIVVIISYFVAVIIASAIGAVIISLYSRSYGSSNYINSTYTDISDI